jgi:hypothetical protein
MNESFYQRNAWRQYRHGRMVQVQSGRCMMWADWCLKDAAFSRNHGMNDLCRHFIKESRAWRKLASVMLAGRLM